MGITVMVKTAAGTLLPAYATAGAAGADVCAAIPQAITLQPMERQAVPTGLYLQIPDGYEAQVRPRSGLALHQGISCLNSPGTIDSDYRGEIKIILINLSEAPQILQPGQRIAQLVFAKTEQVQFVQAQFLNSTEREAGGFGHTGTH